jgi:hypothetical protein
MENTKEKLSDMIPKQDLPKFELDDLEKNEEFQKHSETDKFYMRLQQAMFATNTINIVEAYVRQLVQKIFQCFPNTDKETVKIIVARIEDIKLEKVDELSMGFLTELFTLDDKKIPAALPKEIDSEGTMKELDELLYYRMLVGLIRALDEQLEQAHTWLQSAIALFQEKVPEEIRRILGNPDAMNAYIEDFFQKKLDDPNLPDADKQAVRNMLTAAEKAITLEPIYKELEAQCKKQGNLRSVLYNFSNRADAFAKAAYNGCKRIGITFPTEFISNIEEKLFGEDYKKYKYLFSFLVARYIKYKDHSLDQYDKVFLSHLFANVVQIARSSDIPEQDNCKELKAKFKPYLKKTLDLVIQNL